MSAKSTLLSVAIFGIGFAALLRLVDGPGAEAIPRVLTLAMLGVVPLSLLALPSVGPTWDRLVAVAAVGLPVAGALGVIALWRPEPEAGLWASGWMGFALLLAFVGALRMSKAFRPFDAARAISASALLFVPVGAGWLVASRMGARPLGFDPILVVLTAVHFHFAALAAPVLASRVVDALDGRLRRVAAAAGVVVVASIPVVAVGLTLSAELALVGASALAVALLIVGGLTLTHVQRTARSRWARGLLVISGLSVILSMPLAVAYQWGQVTGQPLVDLELMIRLHGYANAHGFATCGLLAWAIEARRGAR
ncbi:MAG TPA: YndJ family transporter [Sandaracinaceae bacterium LLY-WYZ-13_1]|nr:YndJ family transporter [Sandaracinaceae bacterium LLY-WYZ-13_1]